GHRPVVLTVGRLQQRKGHDRMILALHELKNRVPDVLYAIVGDGERRQYLEELVSREGLADHVHFLGELEDDQIIECYQQCDVFLLPNREVAGDTEGFGIVLVEAQSCGKPVVAGDSGGTVEAMLEPETGFIVDCREPKSIADTVGALLVDEERRVRMGIAARQWVVANLDWSPLVKLAREMFECGEDSALNPKCTETITMEQSADVPQSY
ncbi:MAG: glycosyltransferase, partial [Pirellulales bacterium]|nr:glycosyltransferase [Pirellulales bacterium]